MELVERVADGATARHPRVECGTGCVLAVKPGARMALEAQARRLEVRT